MKKSIFLIIFLISGFFFLGTNDVTAQWCYKVQYEDELCDCGNISSKTVEYCIYDIVIQDYIVACTTISLPSGNPFTLSGDEDIIYDAQDRYIISARVSYYDTGLCCTGWAAETIDGDELVDCDITLQVDME